MRTRDEANAEMAAINRENRSSAISDKASLLLAAIMTAALLAIAVLVFNHYAGMAL